LFTRMGGVVVEEGNISLHKIERVSCRARGRKLCSTIICKTGILLLWIPKTGLIRTQKGGKTSCSEGAPAIPPAKNKAGAFVRKNSSLGGLEKKKTFGRAGKKDTDHVRRVQRKRVPQKVACRKGGNWGEVFLVALRSSPTKKTSADRRLLQGKKKTFAQEKNEVQYRRGCGKKGGGIFSMGHGFKNDGITLIKKDGLFELGDRTFTHSMLGERDLAKKET